MKTLTFTASSNTGFQLVPVAQHVLSGPALELMDAQTELRLPRSSAMNGAELAHVLARVLDELMRAEVDGRYPENQHSVIVDAIRGTLDLLVLVTSHPAAAWESREGTSPDPEPVTGDVVPDDQLGQGDPLPGTLA